MTTNFNPAVVWAEFPVSDLKAGCTFYGAVLDTELKIQDFGGGEIVFLPMKGQGDVSGHIYPGKPAPRGTGPTVHLAINGKLEDATARSVKAGATTVGEPVTIPAGRFQYIEDPDGNSVGLFEVAA